MRFLNFFLAWALLSMALNTSIAVGAPKTKPSTNANTIPPLPKKYEEAFEKLKTQRTGIPCDRPIRAVTRLGDNTIRLESFICMEGDFKLFPKIAGDWPHYKDWLLDQINERVGGGGYFIKFLGVDNPVKDEVVVKYMIDIPLFKKERVKKFRMSSQSYTKAFVLAGEGIVDPQSLMVYANAEMTAYPVPEKDKELWVYVEGKAKLKSDILYAALPEKVLKSEAGDRIHRILENYQTRELTLSPSPK